MSLRSEDFELYWIRSAGVHGVVKCSRFRLLNDYPVRPYPPLFNAVAVKVAVKLRPSLACWDRGGRGRQ